MPTNQYVNKVIIGGEVKIDLTSDTAEASNVLKDVTFHDKAGTPQVGTYEGMDTSDATATDDKILKTYTAYANGEKITGVMAHYSEESSTETGAEKWAGTITDVSSSTVSVIAGYHDGTTTVGISSEDVTKLQDASNIKKGVTILGITGTMEGYTLEDNDAGGQTLTIG